MKDSYPLQWPAGWRRVQDPSYSKFKPGSPYAESMMVYNELDRLGANNVVITSNMQYRADGVPYARQTNLDDTGVAVYFTLDGEEQCIPCDKWVTLGENLRAVWKTIEALRGLDRWGAKDMVNAAFRGFKALPESIVTPAPKRDWWVVLGVQRNDDPVTVKRAYRHAQSLTHPDAGGSIEAFKEVQDAYEQWRNL